MIVSAAGTFSSISGDGELLEIDALPHSQKFMAHMLLACRNKVRETRSNKPFTDWTVGDIKTVVASYGDTDT